MVILKPRFVIAIVLGIVIFLGLSFVFLLVSSGSPLVWMAASDSHSPGVYGNHYSPINTAKTLLIPGLLAFLTTWLIAGNKLKIRFFAVGVMFILSFLLWAIYFLI